MTTTTPNPAALPGAGLRHLDDAVRRADGDTPPEPQRTALTADITQRVTAYQADQAERSRAAAAALITEDDTPDTPEQAEAPEPRPAFPVPQPPPIQPQRPLTREQYIRRFCLQYALQYFTGLTESDEHQLFAAAKEWAAWIQHG